MAENISQEQLELEKKRLVEIQKQLKAIEELTDVQKIELRNTERQIALTDRRIAQAKKKAELQKIENKEFTSFSKRFRAMSQDVQNQLKGTSTSAAVYLSLGREISKEKARQAKYADKEDAESQRLLANSQERESVMSDITYAAAEQAKATQRAEDELRGISDVERRIKDIKESTGIYNAIQKKQLIDQLQLTEKLRIKEERLKTIKEEQQGMFEALPESIQGAVGVAKKFGTALKNGALPIVLLASLLAATLISFTKLDEAAKEFRNETGLTNTQMTGIKSDANEIAGEFGNLGVEAKNVFDTVSALKSEFSDIANFSKETTAALTVLNANFGVSADTAAKVQSQFESIGGLSSETAASVQMQVANMAKLAGVAPKKVLEDIAENAEATSTFFKGDLTALTKNAVQARRMGTSLKEQVALAEKLLDFEGSIEEELVAATFVGGQFNLSRARALAMEGKLAEANAETLSQIQRSGDFRKKDYFTQQQLAKAAGISVEEINKQLNAQEKLNSLSGEQKKAAEDAISKGLDITNISADQLALETEKFSQQQEQQAQLEKLSNMFTGIASTIGSVLTPLLEAIIPIFEVIMVPVQFIANLFKEIVSSMYILLPMLAAMGVYLAIAKKQAIQLAFANLQGAITGIFKSFSSIPLGIGIPLAIGAVAGLVSMFSKYNKAGDVMSPADGKTRISTKEGGLFELSPNDDLIAAPGAATALANNGQQVGGTQQAAPQLNLSALAAPLNAMINEIKALRADMASGKIAVHMDGAKVTAGVSNQVNKSTRNNFAIS